MAPSGFARIQRLAGFMLSGYGGKDIHVYDQLDTGWLLLQLRDEVAGLSARIL